MFYSVTLKDGILYFSDGYTREATKTEIKHCKGRHKVLAYKENNQYCLIYWADLHRHSGYSLMDSSIKISDMVQFTEYAGALTDHGNMRGSLEYYKAMRTANKFPIIGEEFYANSIDGKKACNHLILLATTWEGYHNLTKLSTLANTNFYKKPQINLDMLRAYHAGLICSSACLSGEIARALCQKDKDENKRINDATKIATVYHDIFQDNYYLEIQRHKIQGEEEINQNIIRIAKEQNIKVIATTDAHYTTINDTDIHQILMCIGTKSKYDDPARSFAGSGYHLHTINEMEEIFADIPEALDNTLEILQKCSSFEIKTGNIQTPEFNVPAPYKTEEEYFVFLCWKGLKKRYHGNISKEAKERLQYEIDVIKHMKYCGYFLIVWDFILWAKKHNIPVGPGRGSAVGCLVAYSLGITDINPLEYGLLFERFLNPERISMPDIDSDFAKSGRPKVIEYVRQKYKTECVSKIIDISKLRAKVVIHDVCRVMKKTYTFSDKITNLIPSVPNITLKQAMLETPQLQTLYKSDNEVKKIWDYAVRLEGLPRGVSVHACGILIAPSAVSNYMPQELAINRETGEKEWVTQYPGPQCEEMGLLKMDFLGLRMLDAIDNTINIINKENGTHYTFNDIPLTDAKIYRLLKNQHTGGVFQVESPGMQSLLKKMFNDVSAEDDEIKGKEHFERLIAAIALYRPGPMDEIPQYLQSMQTGKIHYDTPALKRILHNTYGVLVYQEQAMMIVRVLAGFSKGQSDIIRKGMAKKKKAIMSEYGEYFLYGSAQRDASSDKPLNIKGCVANGIPESVAKTIWDKMAKFGAYAFNKSHACAYAHLTARTAYLSAYYKVEFMKCNLDSFSGNADKIEYYAAECKKRKIKLLPPDINSSNITFKIEKLSNGRRGIRYPLTAIKGVGDIASKSIVEERKKGSYKDINDFIMRTATTITSKIIECLVNSGALDCFEGTRKAKIQGLPMIEKTIKEIRHTDFSQLNFFDAADGRIPKIKIADVTEYSDGQLAEKEKEYMGFTFNWPTITYRKMLKAKGKNIIPLCNIEKPSNYKNDFLFIGIVQDLKRINFTSGCGMFCFTVEDEFGTAKCVCFDKAGIRKYQDIAEGEVCYFKGILKDNPKYGKQVEITGSYLLVNYSQRKKIEAAI